MKTKEEIKKWLLANCVNERGVLDLRGLDLTDFEGDVFIDGLKVGRNLFQRFQIVKGDLAQYGQKVGGNLNQSDQNVKKDLWQDSQEVEGDLYE